MRIDIVTCLPELLESPLNHSIVGRAQAKGVVEIHIHNLRDYGLGKSKNVDDYPYGGGAGMILRVEPFFSMLEKLTTERTYDQIIYLSPDGKTLDQPLANGLATETNLLLLCGHYKGIDQRIRDRWVSMEISIGDYVLSGGELAAAVLVDSVVRLLPKVLSDETSALTDSFQDGLLAPPAYTRPAHYQGMDVPEILLSGNEAKIEEWRLAKSIEKTKERRPDLYKKYSS